MEVTQYKVDEYVSIEKRARADWVVFSSGMVLNDDLEWEYEPMPSNRSEEFKRRTRFSSARKAELCYRVWRALAQGSRRAQIGE